MKLPPRLEAAINAVETGQMLTPETGIPLYVMYRLMQGSATPPPPQGDVEIMEIYAEMVVIGAATLSRESLEPTPQAEELGLSLLPEKWLLFMQMI